MEIPRLDTITQNMGAVDANTRVLTINSAYGSNDSATGQNVIDINGSTKVDEALQYEDVEEVRKAYHEKKNEFELSENNAYCHTHAEDVAESFYDNDAYEN